MFDYVVIEQGENLNQSSKKTKLILLEVMLPRNRWYSAIISVVNFVLLKFAVHRLLEHSGRLIKSCLNSQRLNSDLFQKAVPLLVMYI